MYLSAFLDVRCEFKKRDVRYAALNETLRKVNGTLYAVYINGRIIRNFRGVRLCVAAPTGSTGLTNLQEPNSASAMQK